MTQDLELRTLGKGGIGGLRPMETMGAHPKAEAKAGVIYAFGMERTKIPFAPSVELFKLSPSGEIQGRRVDVPTDGYPFLHDIVDVGEFLVVPLAPIETDIMGIFTGKKTPKDAISWNGNKKSELVIVPKAMLDDDRGGHEMIRIPLDACAAFHFASGKQEGNHLSFVAVVHDDFLATLNAMSELVRGQPTTPNSGRLMRFDVDLETKQVTTKPMSSKDIPLEFPVIDTRKEGNAGPSIWVVAGLGDSPFPNMYQRYHRDRTDGAVDSYTFEGSYVQEGVFIPKDGSDPASEEGYLSGVVFTPDDDGGHSDLVLLDAQRLSDGPIARMRLPEVIPFGLHGTWVPPQS